MKINWKGNLIAVGCISVVAGAYLYFNPIQTTPRHELSIHERTEQDLKNITASVDNSSDITDDDNSPFVDDSYMQDKPEIKVGSPYQDVLQVMGEPDDKVVTKGRYGSSELWTYGNKDIFFEDGIVESITEVK